MTRKECLEQAAKCVLQDRQDQYGDVEDCFKKIARLWNAYLPSTIELEPFDVACMMALLKIARIQANPKHGDSWVDLAGYAACGADLAVPEPFRYDKPKAEGCEEPAYNPDADVVGGVVTLEWPRGKILEKRYASGRNEKCAEGCEALVEKDAPQTREELMQRIVDCNPSIYKPRTPTGEELAEMAEEEGHE